MISRQILKMKEDYIDLFTLQSHVKEAVEGNFTDLIWVKAEIAGISCRQNGHCYMDLSQSRNGQVVAKARATVWAFRWNLIDRQFRSVTGSALVAGMEILAAVKVNYHPVYGFSLNVDDIDPEFTLGLGERKRRETIERLAGEGLLDVQKGLRLPALPYSLAVISAKGAAGYGDFRHHLLDNEYGFAFNVKLFEALMQGNEAPASIVRALSEIISSLVHYDAILIMRGGGSELDLACFDDYDLAATIARCPLPVITAIGHDKDHHVADMVAYASVKTPTALADLFLGLYIAQDQYLVKMSSRLTMLFNNRLSAMGSALDLVRSRILAQTESRLSRAESKVDNLALTVSGAASGRLSAQEHRLDRLQDRFSHATGMSLLKAESAVDSVGQKIRGRAAAAISAAASYLLTMETKISAVDPRNILRKGFVLALDSGGVKMDSAASAKVGDSMRMMFADGTVRCGVFGVDLKDNVSDAEDSSSASEVKTA